MMVRPDEDVLLGLLPFYHIYGLVIVQFGALARGTKLVTMPKFEPITFLESIQNHKVMFMIFTCIHVFKIITEALTPDFISQFEISNNSMECSGSATMK